nr:MAG TPA: hypothetical protein [Caudoviricetes sp.]
MTQSMYIGPTIPGIVRSNTIYMGELPNRLKELIGELPVINSLIVSIEALPEAKKALAEQGSVENVAYERVLNYRKER